MHNGFIIQIKTVDLKGRIFEFLSKTFPKTIFNQVFLMFHLLSAVKNIMHLSISLINNVRLMKYNIFPLLKVCCVYLTEKQVHTIHTVSQEYIYIHSLPLSTHFYIYCAQEHKTLGQEDILFLLLQKQMHTVICEGAGHSQPICLFLP